MFNRREVAAILAGLRLLEELEVNCDGFSLLENEIATGYGALKPLSVIEIDELCKMIEAEL